jgi:DNA polymerase III subunit chi
MATEVNFYHLTKSSLEDALPRLLLKTLQAGERAVVLLGSEERVDSLNTYLWTYDDRGFLPHGSAKDGEADRQPIWLTHLDENPNGAAFLFVTDRAKSEKVGEFRRCFEIFDGRDDAAKAAKDGRITGRRVIAWPTGNRLPPAAGKRRRREANVIDSRDPAFAAGSGRPYWMSGCAGQWPSHGQRLVAQS